MNNNERKQCEKIIHTAAVAASAAASGLAQIPLSDNAVITPIQIGMLQALAGVFGKHLSETAGASVLSSLVAPEIGRAGVQLILGWIPGLGNVVNAAVAGVITEAIGWMAAESFDESIG